jgi:hypothetical protein
MLVTERLEYHSLAMLERHKKRSETKDDGGASA